MAEILTESFCERCGNRYTFESPARRSNPFGALGTVGRGIRNFVASPDQTIDEAFAVARAESEMRQTAHQLEAFHQTFNFCLSCRQYTCGNCWNSVEGRCQSCAPMPEAEMLAGADIATDSPVVFEAMAIAMAATAPVAEPTFEPEPEPLFEPEPTADPEAVAEVELEPVTELEPEPVEPDVSVPEADIVEPVAAVEAPAEPPVEAEAAEAPGPATGLGFPPGISLDEEIAAYDLRVAALAVPPTPFEPAPAPPADPTLEQPSWPMAAERSAAVQPPRIVRADVPDVPAVSEVTLPAAQATDTCAACGLAVSATARFCRRCGTPQHSA